jgi:hypothetical protein
LLRARALTERATRNSFTSADEFRDMAFECNLMTDPVFASDGFTYERDSMEKWIKAHGTSPRTGEPLEHNFLMPNMMARQMIAAWCEQNGMPVPAIPKPTPKQAAAGGGAADAPLLQMLQKPVVSCELHPKELPRVFCMVCNRAVCVLCAVDTDICKSHATKAFEPLIEELKTDREGWARAQRECDEGAQQLCAAIQADGDTKKRVYNQEIDKQVAALLQQVRSAAAARSAAMGAILLKRQEREELVAGASLSPEVALKGSAAAAVVASALGRARAPIPPGSAAEFRAAAAPAAAVGRVILADPVVDPEDQAARAAAAAAAEAAALAAALGPLGGSDLFGRVADRNKVQQFAALMRTRLTGKRYRLLYKWSRDGRSNASFHQHCDNQVRDCKGLPVAKCACSRCGAGAYAGHRALHHGAHVRRICTCALD